MISESALLIEEEQDRQEAIEDIQAVLAADTVRGAALSCLTHQRTRAGPGGSIYWNLVSRTFLKRLLPSHDDAKDVVCDDS